MPFWTRAYHWRHDPTTDEWQCWVEAFKNTEHWQMNIVGVVAAAAVEQAACDIKRLFMEQLYDRTRGRLIFQEV